MNVDIGDEDKEFYSKGKKYWSEVKPTVDGMLGGFPELSNIDIQSSEKFIKKYFTNLKDIYKLRPKEANKLIGKQRNALDCGGGIGRVSKNLLLKYFNKIDLLEQNENFLKEARNYIGEEKFDKRVNTICSSLHNFENFKKYDSIWCQWVTGYLTDKDFIQFLKKCKNALNKPHGILFIKDNHTSSGEIEIDLIDSSFTRSYDSFLKLFNQCNFRVLDEKKQNNFPSSFYPVKMFALSPF